MCPSSVRHPSAGYNSFDEFADHSTTNRQPYWFTPLLHPGSTIAICCWPEHQSLLPTSCSGSWMLQLELWAAWRSTTAAWHTCFTLNLFQNNLREPDMQIDCFCRTLKTCLFDQYSALERIRGASCDDALYKLTFTFTFILLFFEVQIVSYVRL